LVPARDRRIWLLAVLIAPVTVVAFLPTLDNGFVTWDDQENFLKNFDYRGLGASQVRWAWTTFRVGVYQPLGWLILEAQYVVWKLDPRGYHLVSILLHTANAVVLYVLTVTLLARCRVAACLTDPWACHLGAGLATALFVVHPLRVEVVAWASCQSYLPCALFSMLAVLAYLRAVGTGPSPRPGWLVASLVLFGAALLCKAVAVSLPAILLILDVYPLGRLGGGPGRWFGASARKVLWEKVPFVLLSFVFMGLAIAARSEPHATLEAAVANYQGSARIAQACYEIWFYIIKTVLPLDITANYPLPERIDWSAPAFLTSILGTLTVTVGLLLLRRNWPGLLAAWLSYLVILAPNLGIIRISLQLAADRYSYVAMLGGVVLAAAGLSRLGPLLWRGRPGAIVLATVSLLGLGCLFILTRDQCRSWRSTEALWTHALAHGAARSGQVHDGLGLVHFDRGEFDEAAARFTEAIRVNPSYSQPYNNLAIILFQRGKIGEAAALFSRALELNPNLAGAYQNLGAIRFHQGRFDEAAAHYAQALRIDPVHAEALNNCAFLLAACPEAKYRDDRRAVELANRAGELTEWKNPGCLDTLAAAHAEAGDFDAAVAWQTRAIELLSDRRKQEDYRSRLRLYRAGQPYRAASPGSSPADVRP
jgi:tetratricopeptide (TPR) repeat protein